MITAKELIKHLQTLPQDMPIVYQIHSEHKLLELTEIRIEKLQPARNDGWVHDVWRVRDEPRLEKVEYLVFPGN